MPSATEGWEAPLQVTADQLVAAYVADPAAAHVRYGNHRILVDGVVADVYMDFTRHQVIALSPQRNRTPRVLCYTQDTVMPRQRVILRGEPQLMGNILLADCALVSLFKR
jgi:hypothetical protein